MNVTLDGLLACLELSEVDEGVVTGPNLEIDYHRIFGGQILAQVLVAAAKASPEKSVKSLHVLFPREGDTSKPMHYEVRQLQEGRTFGTTEVVATQDGKVIAVAVASVHVDEDGLHRCDAPPAAGTPDGAELVDLGMVPWETRIAGGVDLGDRGVGEPTLDWWMKTPAIGSDDVAVHQALLAHATDLTIIGTALRPIEGYSQADSTVALLTAVTSHTVWFHQPFRVDGWLQLHQHSPVIAKGRAYGRGDVWSGGELVASFAQESMVRQTQT